MTFLPARRARNEFGIQDCRGGESERYYFFYMGGGGHPKNQSTNRLNHTSNENGSLRLLVRSTSAQAEVLKRASLLIIPPPHTHAETPKIIPLLLLIFRMQGSMAPSRRCFYFLERSGKQTRAIQSFVGFIVAHFFVGVICTLDIANALPLFSYRKRP
jgi:hypothetical protein